MEDPRYHPTSQFSKSANFPQINAGQGNKAMYIVLASVEAP